MTPFPVIQNKTPYYLLFNKELDYNSLKVFGLLCYVKNNKISDKFEPREIK